MERCGQKSANKMGYEHTLPHDDVEIYCVIITTALWIVWSRAGFATNGIVRKCFLFVCSVCFAVGVLLYRITSYDMLLL